MYQTRVSHPGLHVTRWEQLCTCVLFSMIYLSLFGAFGSGVPQSICSASRLGGCPSREPTPSGAGRLQTSWPLGRAGVAGSVKLPLTWVTES